MHLELVELLRCPVVHAPSVLVASADTIADRFIAQGLLGCPECLAEYPIRNGVTQFGDAHASSHERTINPISRDVGNQDSSEPMRLAAQLGLTPDRTAYALIGFDLATVAALREIVAARVLLFNAVDETAIDESTLAAIASAAAVGPFGVATIQNTLPLVAGKFDGIALGAVQNSPDLVQQASTALRSGGRLVAPVSVPLPSGVRELVRDEHVWVAERESVASAPISILRR